MIHKKLLLSVLTFACSSLMWSGSLTFTGPGNWSNPALWGGSAPASPTDILTINGACTLDGVDFNEICTSLTINAGATLTILPNNSIDITGSLNLNGGPNCLIIECDITGSGAIYNDGTGVITGAGTVNVQRFITANLYHYLSSPVTTSPSSVFPSPNQWQFNTGASTTWNNCWFSIAGNLFPSQGYAVKPAVNTTVSFSGVPNTGTINYPAIMGVNTPGQGSGWNLIGNPYPSGLNTNAFIADNNATRGIATLYLWDDNGSNGFNYSSADYATLNPAAAASGGGTSGHIPTAIIQPGQAFFAQVTSPGNVVFNDAQRTLTALQMESLSSDFFFRTGKPAASSNGISSFNLHISTDNGLQNDMSIAFLAGATNGFDQLYDAPKLVGNSNLSLYSTLNNSPYAIQSFGLMGNTSKVVPVTLLAGLAGDYTFTVSSSINMENIQVVLQDSVSNTNTVLTSASQINFTVAGPDTINKRFYLHFIPTPSGINQVVPVKEIGVYNVNHTVYFNLNGHSSAEATVYDMMGKAVTSKILNGNQINELYVSAAAGCYIVKVVSDGGASNKKIVIQ